MRDKAPIEENIDYINEFFPDFEDSPLEVPTELMTLADAASNMLMDRTKMIMDTVVQYKELMMMYNCAMKEIRTKFEVLNMEFNTRYQRNPIKFISTRLKRSTSIIEKLTRNGIPISIDGIEHRVNDVAGVRVICSYIDDIYIIAKALVQQDDVKLVSQKDYIAEPKPNGYRSLHLIVSVPVFFAEQKKDIKVEVQIRTIAMDFWASLEHQLKYKKRVENEQEIVAQLRECAEVIAKTDNRMQDIRKQIEESAEEPTEEEILFEKIRKFDIAFE